MKNIIFLFVSILGLSNTGYSQNTYQLSTHILDVHQGKPAPNVTVELLKQNNNNWSVIATEKTDQDGRIRNFLNKSENNKGTYKLKFYTEPYLKSIKQSTIFPYIEIIFSINNTEHYHIPIVLSGNGYSTYRGS